jgi:hypothetical protein
MDHEGAIQNLAVESYLLGEMTPGEREAFEQHFFDCSACADDVRNAMQFMAGARDVLAVDPASVRASPAQTSLARNTRPRESERRWFAWFQPQGAAAAIALLATVCVVETVAIPTLRHRLDDESAPRVVDSAFLRPQTRGAAPILKVAAGEPVIVMFDPPESAAGKLQFVVKSTDGEVDFRLSSDAPRPGEPVMLSIPKLNLKPGDYMLVVEAPAATGQDGQELGRYPFDLERP